MFAPRPRRELANKSKPRQQWNSSLSRRCDPNSSNIDLHITHTPSRTSPSTSRRRQVCTDNTPTHQPLTCTQFDSRKGATWHCIVGRNFGSFVTHGKSGHDTLSNAPHANIPRRNQALHLLLPGPLRNPALQDSVSNMNDGPLGSDVSERRWIPCICFGLYAQTIWLVTHTFARM